MSTASDISASAAPEHEYVVLPPLETSASKPAHEEPLWKGYIRRRLAAMRDEWESDPRGPSLETLNGAWSVAVGEIRPEWPTPSVLAGEDGSVELVWRRGGWHIELVIQRDGSAQVWMRNRTTDLIDEGPLDELRDVFRDVVSIAVSVNGRTSAL